MDLQQAGIGENVIVDPQFGGGPILHGPIAARHLNFAHVVRVPRAEEIRKLRTAQVRDAVRLQPVLYLLVHLFSVDEHLKHN